MRHNFIVRNIFPSAAHFSGAAQFFKCAHFSSAAHFSLYRTVLKCGKFFQVRQIFPSAAQFSSLAHFYSAAHFFKCGTFFQVRHIFQLRQIFQVRHIFIVRHIFPSATHFSKCGIFFKCGIYFKCGLSAKPFILLSLTGSFSCQSNSLSYEWAHMKTHNRSTRKLAHRALWFSFRLERFLVDMLMLKDSLVCAPPVWQVQGFFLSQSFSSLLANGAFALRESWLCNTELPSTGAKTPHPPLPSLLSG